MSGLIDRAKMLFQSAASDTSQLSHFIPIPAAQVDDQAGIGGTLKAHEEYFEVRLNELFLVNHREWFTTYDPMAVAVPEYKYHGQPAAVPFVVGPSMLESIGNRLPQGMVLADTRITGPQPYRGDGLAITVVLYKLQRDDMLRKMLKLVEKTAKTLDLSGAITVYSKIADAVLDGIDEVRGTGTASPVLGRRQEFLPVSCGYYALIDGTVARPTEDSLWVKNKQLMTGPKKEMASPFRAGDYLLFSISRVPREDLSGLPFYAVYSQVMQDAGRGARKDFWESAKVKMATLYSLLDESPDLTRGDAKDLADKWTKEMVLRRDRAVGLANLGPGQPAYSSEEEQRASRALRVLQL